MPSKNTKKVSVYLTPDQIEAVRKIGIINMSEFVKLLIRNHVRFCEEEWPESPGRGEHERRKQKKE